MQKCRLNIIKKKKERLQKKKARERYQDLSEEEKNGKCQYAHMQYRNLSEEEKYKKYKYGCKQYKNLSED